MFNHDVERNVLEYSHTLGNDNLFRMWRHNDTVTFVSNSGDRAFVFFMFGLCLCVVSVFCF